MIAPKQIITSPMKKGSHINSVMFSTPSFNAVGEPFKEVGAVIARKTNMAKIQEAGHEKVFSPSKIVKLSYKPPYDH